MFDSRMWRGLLAWLDTGEWFDRLMVRRNRAREQLVPMLAPEQLPQLRWQDLTEGLCHSGALRLAEGEPLDENALDALGADELARRIEAGEILVTGNQAIDLSLGSHVAVLPGMEDVELEALRTTLMQLLHEAPDPCEVLDRAPTLVPPPHPYLASLALCITHPERFGVWHPSRVAGARKLAWLLGTQAQWAGRYDDHRSFNELLVEIRDASSGRLADLLAVDALLAHLAQMPEPRSWKIAIALSEADAEADDVASRCLRQGFAALNAPMDGADPNVGRLRDVLPGDWVVMHLRGRIGAVGRAVRPYYCLDPEDASMRDRAWPHRVDVEWLVGDRSYGALLTGAQQRFTVVELDQVVFWQIAEMYEDEPDWARVLRPRRGAWVFTCDSDGCHQLAHLDRPLPLRDHWRLSRVSDSMRVGDCVFIRRTGSDPGICGVARILAEPEASSAGGGFDLLHERIIDPPLSDDRLRADERTVNCAVLTNPTAEAVQLSGTQVAAVREMLAMPEESYFVLMIGQRPRPALRRKTVYRYSHRAGGRPAELTEAARWASARCLIYHGAPDYTFVGVASAVDVREETSPDGGEPHMAITTELQRFTAATRTRPLSLANWAHSAAPGDGAHSLLETRTVMPIHPRDFYRVVAAGLEVAPKVMTQPAIELLAHDCCVPRETACEIERLLRERGQMIFYGPPGTGKTWCALHFADYLSDGDPRRSQVVQFHPAYSYEDFVEGIRPEAVPGPDGRTEIHYPVVPGAFVSFCDRARRDPANTYVFVIDEINRAQVSKVFGELMMLLEYRGRELHLAYTHLGPDAGAPWNGEQTAGFCVPDNVLVLGTMNTADLRRRFVFYPFFPDDDAFLRPLFRTWLARNAPDMIWVADMLDLINERLLEDVGRSLLLGPSYFMRDDLTEERLHEIWRFQITPLLEEYFAGMPGGPEEYDLDRLIAQARPSHMVPPEPEPSIDLELVAEAMVHSLPGGPNRPGSG